MGRYDGPHFEREDIDVVSIWVAHCPFEQIPEEYWIPDWDSEDDAKPWNQFSSDFGFGFYDDDLIECYCQDDRSAKSVFEQLKFMSYSSSFIDAAVNTAKEKGIEKTVHVFLMYNYAYDPKITGIESSDYLTFLGAFPFDEDANPVEKWTS